MKPARLAGLSIVLNISSLLVFAFAVTNAAFQKFALATEMLSLIGVVNLALSIVALTRSMRNEEEQPARRMAWVSLVIAIGMILVIVILLLNIWVYSFRL